MKPFYKLILLSLVIGLAVSCEQNGPGNKKHNVAYAGTDPDCYEFSMNASEGNFYASENGVSIQLDKIERNNVVFTLVPGQSIRSYRVDVYPKAILYNFLLEEGLIDASADDVEDCIINLLTSSMGAGGYIFDYESNAEEFACKQFDWTNSNYAQYKLVPECEYFVTVVGCYDKEAQQVASLSISHFTTPTQPLVGNPQISLQHKESYQAFLVEYIPNEDCKYFYNWSYLSEDIDEYIDTFGETMMRDFMRSAVTAALDVKIPENLSTYVGFSEVTSDARFATVAIALDVNQTPARHITRVDLSLKDVPEDAELGEASVEINKNRISATAMWFDITIEKEAPSAYYNILPAAQADAYANASTEERAAYAKELATEGYGVANQNFTFDSENEVPTGAKFTAKNEYMYDLQPETEYKVVYCAKNVFGQVSDLFFSESFTTKKLDFSRPEDCLCNDDFKFYLKDPSRTGWTYYAEYDWDDMAIIRFQIVYPDIVDSPYQSEQNPGTREELISHLFGVTGTYGNPIANTWWALPNGVDYLGYFGLASGTEYVVACCAEDINGVVGPVTFHKATTRDIVPGPNPTMKIDAQISDDGTTLTCKFTSNEDSKQVKYFASSNGSYKDLGLNKLLPENDLRGEYGYKDFLRIWERYAIELGLLSDNISVTSTYEVDPNSDEFLLVGAIAIGEDKGVDCYSNFEYVIYYKGELHQLSEYRTPPAN